MITDTLHSLTFVVFDGFDVVASYERTRTIQEAKDMANAYNEADWGLEMRVFDEGEEIMILD